MSNSVWYKNERDDKIWWKETEAVGEWIFSFNKKKGRWGYIAVIIDYINFTK